MGLFCSSQSYPRVRIFQYVASLQVLRDVLISIIRNPHRRRLLVRTWLLKSKAWNVVMTLVSLVNVVFNWPQAWDLWHTRNVASISATSMWLLLFVQWGFSLSGWLKRDWFLNISCGLAGGCTTSILLRIYGVQHGWF